MKYEAVITIEGEDAKLLFDAVKAELSGLASQRQETKVELLKDKIRVAVSASDAASCRLGVNGILKAASVFEKIAKVE